MYIEGDDDGSSQSDDEFDEDLDGEEEDDEEDGEEDEIDPEIVLRTLEGMDLESTNRIYDVFSQSYFDDAKQNVSIASAKKKYVFTRTDEMVKTAEGQIVLKTKDPAKYGENQPITNEGGLVRVERYDLKKADKKAINKLLNMMKGKPMEQINNLIKQIEAIQFRWVSPQEAEELHALRKTIPGATKGKKRAQYSG